MTQQSPVASPRPDPAMTMRLVWLGLLSFQILLYAVCWVLGAMDVASTASRGFDVAVFAESKNAVLAAFGGVCFIVALLLPNRPLRKGEAGAGKASSPIAFYVMRLALFELTNVAGFVLAFLNGKNHVLMLPFLALTVLGFMLTQPKGLPTAN